jgi:hypothetical protein
MNPDQNLIQKRLSQLETSSKLSQSSGISKLLGIEGSSLELVLKPSIQINPEGQFYEDPVVSTLNTLSTVLPPNSQTDMIKNKYYTDFPPLVFPHPNDNIKKEKLPVPPLKSNYPKLFQKQLRSKCIKATPAQSNTELMDQKAIGSKKETKFDSLKKFLDNKSPTVIEKTKHLFHKGNSASSFPLTEAGKHELNLKTKPSNLEDKLSDLKGMSLDLKGKSLGLKGNPSDEEGKSSSLEKKSSDMNKFQEKNSSNNFGFNESTFGENEPSKSTPKEIISTKLFKTLTSTVLPESAHQGQSKDLEWQSAVENISAENSLECKEVPQKPRNYETGLPVDEVVVTLENKKTDSTLNSSSTTEVKSDSHSSSPLPPILGQSPLHHNELRIDSMKQCGSQNKISPLVKHVPAFKPELADINQNQKSIEKPNQNSILNQQHNSQESYLDTNPTESLRKQNTIPPLTAISMRCWSKMAQITMNVLKEQFKGLLLVLPQ